MVHWNLFTLSSLLTVASGHVAFGGSTLHQYKSTTSNVNDKDVKEHQNHRTLETEEELEVLQLKWWNWAYCTEFPFSNANYTAMNGVVPNNTIFLAGYPTGTIDDSPATCKSKTPVRTATISTGKQTLFFPLYNRAGLDSEDDWEKCSVLQNETDLARVNLAKDYGLECTNASLVETLYYDLDGKNASYFYLYDDSKRYFSSCDNPNDTLLTYFPTYEGDQCDNELYETIGGMDFGPGVGWWGIDTRTWENGESHTFEFGMLRDCITAKYILTAEGPDEKKCGLFGLGLFCPIEWLKFLLSLFL